MTTTQTASPLTALLGDAPWDGTTDEKLAWASKTWRATVAQARETNAQRAADAAAAPAPWTPRNLHGTGRVHGPTGRRILPSI